MPSVSGRKKTKVNLSRTGDIGGASNTLRRENENGFEYDLEDWW